MNSTTMKGDWNVAKGKIKQKWGSLTDSDLTYEKGREDELIGRIQQRTGQNREEIERFVRQTLNG